MMIASISIATAAEISMGILMLAAFIALIRVVRGPGLSDRVVAIDFLTFIVVSFIGALALLKRDYQYMDVAIVLAVVGFMATISYARYMERITAKTRYDQRKDEE